MSVEDGQLTMLHLSTFPHTNNHCTLFSSVSDVFSHVLVRFLVHRYSVMRENVEANKIEGVDDVDTHYMETGKAQYNEDSDQVSDIFSNVPLCLFKTL